MQKSHSAMGYLGIKGSSLKHGHASQLPYPCRTPCPTRTRLRHVLVACQRLLKRILIFKIPDTCRTRRDRVSDMAQDSPQTSQAATKPRAARFSFCLLQPRTKLPPAVPHEAVCLPHARRPRRGVTPVSLSAPPDRAPPPSCHRIPRAASSLAHCTSLAPPDPSPVPPPSLELELLLPRRAAGSNPSSLTPPAPAPPAVLPRVAGSSSSGPPSCRRLQLLPRSSLAPQAPGDALLV